MVFKKNVLHEVYFTLSAVKLHLLIAEIVGAIGVVTTTGWIKFNKIHFISFYSPTGGYPTFLCYVVYICTFTDAFFALCGDTRIFISIPCPRKRKYRDSSSSCPIRDLNLDFSNLSFEKARSQDTTVHAMVE